jgi:hypothetical protein
LSRTPGLAGLTQTTSASTAQCTTVHAEVPPDRHTNSYSYSYSYGNGHADSDGDCYAEAYSNAKA